MPMMPLAKLSKNILPALQNQELDALKAELAEIEAGMQTQQQAPQQPTQGFGQTDFMQNPMLQAIQGDVTNRLFANQAARGKLGSGSTLSELQNKMAPLAMGFRQQEIGNLMNLFTTGANVAAGQGSQSMIGGQGIGNTLLQGGIGQAQGLLGAGQAQYQGLSDVAGFAGRMQGQHYMNNLLSQYRSPTNGGFIPNQAPMQSPSYQSYSNYA